MDTKDEKMFSEKEVASPSSLEGDKSRNEGPLVDPEEASAQQPSGAKLGFIVTSVAMAVFLTGIDQTIVGTAIPKITDEFHGLAQVSWYGAAYFLTLGSFRPFWGKACKYFPLKPTFIFTIFLFELGSLICGVAPNSIALIIGRALSGVGGAGIATGGTTIIAFSAPPKKRPIFMGLLGASYALAAVAGPLIGGVFSDKVTWRWCFYINLPIGGVVAVLTLIFFRLDTAPKTIKASWKETILQMDAFGIALTMLGMACFILALQYGGTTYAWKSSQVIGLLIGFGLIIITLGIWEIYQDEYAMLPRRLMKQRTLWAPCVFQFLFAGSYFLILYYLPIYFQSILGFSPIKSSVDNLPLIVAFGIFMLTGGLAVSATGHATPSMAVGAALTCVSAGLFYSMDNNISPANWIGYQILAGTAIAFPYMNCLNLAQANADDKDIASVSSIVQFFQTLGGSFSITAAQSAFVNRLIGALTTAAPEVDPGLVIGTGAAELRAVFSVSELPGIISAYQDGIRATFAVSIGMAGLAVFISLLCPWSRLPTHDKKNKNAEHGTA
ncbi:MAG: hypothetical protein M1820_001669 [Bogoriella megaspora]|nr:MAG: hypothetical protein M1820_001669 [Bogoriella megaspora]